MKAADRRRLVLEAAMHEFGEAGFAEVSTEATALESMATAYAVMLSEDPNALRCQLHAWAAASDPDIGKVARETYLDIWRDALSLSGEDADTVRDFMAHGMLLTVVAALDIPEIYADPTAVAEPGKS